MAAKLGLDGKLYYNTAGLSGGSWVELDIVKDVSLSMEKATADVSTRANSGWRAKVGTLKDATLTFQIVHDPTDAGYSALADAFMNNTSLGIRVLDETAGVTWEALCDVNKFNWSQGLEEAQMFDVEISPTYSDTAPTFG